MVCELDLGLSDGGIFLTCVLADAVNFMTKFKTHQPPREVADGLLADEDLRPNFSISKQKF